MTKIQKIILEYAKAYKYYDGHGDIVSLEEVERRIRAEIEAESTTFVAD